MASPGSRDGLRLERTRASTQWRNGTFHNTLVERAELEGASLPVIGEWLFKRGQRVPKAPLPVERPHQAWGRTIDTGLRATWLGHSTVLLEIDGRRVLTDPVLATRIGPVSFVGPRRFHPTPATVEELPPLDAVLVSHDHFDHLCKPTIEQLARRRVPFVTALGVGAYLERFGVDPAVITELDWHEGAEVGGIHFTAQPSQHFSGRGLTSRNRTLWASWVIRSDRHKVFFSGDTGLTPQFAEVGRMHGPFDLVMLEIGAYHPAWGSIHLGPENALAAFELLGGGTLLPVHWGTFNLGLHAWDAPGEELLRFAAARGARILTPRLGEVFEPTQLDGPAPWWRDVFGHPAEAPLIAPA
ncbi:MAG TPA: MBL fold metallo-hydrolase [Kofleriaceae bacterium]|nr:MBL fold metallo-hydrolase [Kofleriaceae bacterium]